MASTNALTARYAAMMGWPCDTVQSWRGKVRHDLFGIADAIILSPRGLLWVQNCAYKSLPPHRAKIDAAEVLPRLDLYGVQIELWEWRRRKCDAIQLWFLRRQVRSGGVWSPPEEWEGPLDLYPKANKRLTI